MVTDDVREEIRARADLFEVIGEHVALKKAGKQFRGLCPFHKEKTPSFFVTPSRGYYKCFGCGESGDVFTFVMKTQGLTFQDAMRQLADRYGVDLPEPGSSREEDPNRPLYEAVSFAAEHYRRQLMDEKTGQVAREYLRDRGIDGEAAERYLLGYAPAERRGLYDAARRHGMDDEVLLAAGLIRDDQRSGEYQDRFRSRLIFPICEPNGRVVGFGGRLSGSGSGSRAPKYINSPESSIYRKSSLLYGLNWSRGAIRRAGVALVVEGYTDFLSLAARGLEHVVAGLGTALTEDQAVLLSRYTERAILLYDSDAAGLRAAFRAGDVLLGSRIHPLLVTLPAGEDPDSLVRRSGAGALESLLESAVDLMELKLKILDERGYLKESQGLRKALDAVLPTLRAVVDPALRDIYVGRVAESTGIRRETLESELRMSPGRGTAAAGSPRQRMAQREKKARGVSAQRILLLLLIRDPERIPKAVERLDADDFPDPAYREVYQALVSAGGVEGIPADDLGDAARECLAGLRLDPEELSNADRIFKDTVNRLLAEPLRRRLDELQGAIRRAEHADDDGEAKKLMQEKMELTQVLQDLKQPLERPVRRVTPPATSSTSVDPEPDK